MEQYLLTGHPWSQTLQTISKFSFLILLLPFFLTSCTTARPQPKPTTVRRHQVTHIVAPGETFWRICKMYDVPLASIMRINRVSDPSELKLGQKLIIPDAAPIQPVVSLFPSHKWQYIIIHHSATEAGNSLAFHKDHLARGWDRGVGYHFVIDNDTSGKIDGQIEVTPRWLKQHDGAHCKASDMNMKGIGVCLVGNFNEEYISAKQMDSLVYLVDKLRRYYRVPIKNILGHKHVPESTTECPGIYFDLADFQKRLRSYRP